MTQDEKYLFSCGIVRNTFHLPASLAGDQCRVAYEFDLYRAEPSHRPICGNRRSRESDRAGCGKDQTHARRCTMK